MNDEQQPNPLRKQCGQIKRVVLTTLLLTTYKTYAVKDCETYDLDWDYKKNQTISTLRVPAFKRDDFLLLVKTFNTLNKVSHYDLYQLNGTHIFGFGRDTDIIQRNVYVDKKWL